MFTMNVLTDEATLRKSCLREMLQKITGRQRFVIPRLGILRFPLTAIDLHERSM